MSVLPIRVGFVGLSKTGWASTALAPSLLLPEISTKYTLTAISTTNEASAAASAKVQADIVGHPVKAYYGDTSRIASDPDVDLVAVAVEPRSHKAALLPAIAAGKHIFVEWPAGNGLLDAIEIADSARKKGVRTMVGLQCRHTPVVKKIKDLVESGKIGKILSCSIIAFLPRELQILGPEVKEINVRTADETAGGTVLDIAVGHQLDTLTLILGDFASVSATTATQYPIATLCDEDGKRTDKTVPVTASDHVAFTGLLKSGAVASIAWRAGHPSTKGRKQLIWEIDGEDGSIRVEDDALWSAFFQFHDSKLYLNGELVEVESQGNPVVGNLACAWEEFTKGEEGRHAKIEDAIRNHQLIDAIRRSAKEGKKVILE